jgi:hypothetical protein
MVTELLVIALILSQLYICAITYAAFRKLEKYESAAMWIIEKWSQTKLVPTELVPTELVPKYNGESNLITLPVTGSAFNGAFNDTINSTIKVLERYAPAGVHSAVVGELKKWYCQLCIELLYLATSKFN